MNEALTPQEAREASLSRNPIKRLGQLAELGSGYNLKKVGWSPLPLYMTRGDLVHMAEIHESTLSMLKIADEATDITE